MPDAAPTALRNEHSRPGTDQQIRLEALGFRPVFSSLVIRIAGTDVSSVKETCASTTLILRIPNLLE
ncbi:MAG: hypothetical protein CMQ21_02050 [Gammaproteobacteria bacterium]|nr:hypothetical protein [Gammaproteobacteria bacterium]